MSPQQPNTPSALPRPIDLAIVGGGISGIALLLGILKHTDASQVRPHLYEANPAFAEVGAGLSFLPNALSAMRVLDPRIIEAYWKLAKPPADKGSAPPKQMYVNFAMACDGRDGKDFKAFDTIYREDIRNMGGPGLHRALFLDTLVDLIPKQGGDSRGQGPYTSFSKRLINIAEQHENVGVELHFADGSSAQADAVVGCDGIKGMTRKIVLTSNGEVDAIAPAFSGAYGYRGLVPLAANTAGQSLHPYIKEHTNLQLGYGGHMMTYPVKNGQLLNVLACHQVPDQEWPHENWVVPATQDDVKRDFEGFGWAVQDVISRLEKTDVWGLFESQPCKSFHSKGKVCLLGDSAHATTPHQGAGAGICMEDAYVLSRLLGELRNGGTKEMENIFTAYDTVRRPRTLKVVKTSKENGLIMGFMWPEIGDFGERIKEGFAHRFDWIWHLDVEKHAEEAIELFCSGGGKNSVAT